jgi:hypothetical protein
MPNIDAVLDVRPDIAPPPAREAPPAPRQRPDLPVVLVVVLGAIGGAVATVRSGGVIDDAYITYRYAQNVADGVGWVYNPGAAEGNAATSPLYVLVLSALARLRIAPPSGANLVTVAAFAAVSACSFVVVRRVRSTSAAAVVVALLITNPWFPYLRGMESMMVLALAAGLVMVAFGAERRPRTEVLVGLLGGLMVLARADSVLLLAPVALVLAGRGRRPPWRAAGVGAAVIAAWCAFALVTMGHVVPETLAAKVAQARSGYWGPMVHLVTFWVAELDRLDLLPWAVPVAALAAGGTVAGLRSARSRDLVACLVAFGGLYLAAYEWVLDVPGYPWYYAPLVYAAVVLAGIGVDALAVELIRPDGRRRELATVVAMALLAGVALVRYPASASAFPGYRSASRWIVANTDARATVATAEIGYIGFATGRRMVDFLGLLDARAIAEVGRGDLGSWVYRERPDVYVTRQPVFPMERAALRVPGFVGAYELVAAGDGMWVFVKRARIDPATARRALLPSALGPVVEQHRILRSPIEAEAFETAIGIILARGDLHPRLFADERLDLPTALEWSLIAARGGDDGDDSGAVLRRYEHELTAVASHVKDSGLGTVPFTGRLD